MKAILVILMVLGCIYPTVQAVAAQEISTSEVEYTYQGTTMKGYLAYDKSLQGKRPAVLVVHEWWGLNDYVRKRARVLAELGYTTLALDMYGEGKMAMHPDDAKKFSSELMKNFDVARARFTAAADFLRKQPTVDPGRIAAIGYCFGGGVVLDMARQGADLKGVASFHGSLVAVQPAKKGEVKARILVLNGADDKFISAEQIAAFKEEMKNAEADLTFLSYPGAVHSFTNPDADEYSKKFNMPVAYNKEVDTKSWDELKKFLNAVFR